MEKKDPQKADICKRNVPKIKYGNMIKTTGVFLILKGKINGRLRKLN